MEVLHVGRCVNTNIYGHLLRLLAGIAVLVVRNSLIGVQTVGNILVCISGNISGEHVQCGEQFVVAQDLNLAQVFSHQLVAANSRRRSGHINLGSILA